MTQSQPAIRTRWLRSYHAGQGPTLVCLPHAGGAASTYLRLSAALQSDVQVLAVQYPGRQDRYAEAPLRSIADLADGLVAALADALPDTRTDQPLALFGHSMGAIVGYETARRLEAANRPPAMLFVSGRSAPRHRSAAHPYLHSRSDEDLVAELIRLGGTEPELLRDPEILAMVLPAVRADYQAIETYAPAPGPSLTCPIAALTGDTDPRAPLPEVRDWAEYTSGDFSLRPFPGGHFYLLEQQEALATAIRSALTTSSPRPPTPRTAP